jgi:hypothetical protein
MATGSLAALQASPHEILVNKLCALLGRSEVRDLEDVRALLEAGTSLERALTDAPKKDSGFSALTLAWVLSEMPVQSLAQMAGWSSEQATRLEVFRDRLTAQIGQAAKPK